MVYIYCRISSIKQTDGVSLETQESELTTISKKFNWKIQHVQKVVSSAYNTVPDGFDMYTSLHNKKILVYSVDRFSRSVENGSEMAKELIENNNTIFFWKEKLKIDSCDINNDKWKIFVKCLEQSENESKMISDRVKAGKRKAMEQGRFCGGPTPFGYKKIKLIQDGYFKLVPDETTYPIINFIIACKTINTKKNKINELLGLCGVDVKGKNALNFLDDETDIITCPFDFSEIVDVLNEYNVNGRKWNYSIVKSIYFKFDNEEYKNRNYKKDEVNIINEKLDAITFFN